MVETWPKAAADCRLLKRLLGNSEYAVRNLKSPLPSSTGLTSYFGLLNEETWLGGEGTWRPRVPGKLVLRTCWPAGLSGRIIALLFAFVAVVRGTSSYSSHRAFGHNNSSPPHFFPFFFFFPPPPPLCCCCCWAGFPFVVVVVPATIASAAAASAGVCPVGAAASSITTSVPRGLLAQPPQTECCPNRFPPSTAFSGRAAICLPNLPKPLISLPTSAALSVLNLSTTPDSGSYVFNTNAALGTLGAASFSFSSFSASLFRFLAFSYLGESRFGILYLVVMRVWQIWRFHMSVNRPHQDADGRWRRRTYRRGPRLQKQGGLALPFVACG
jgi:hypothetical protein